MTRLQSLRICTENSVDYAFFTVNEKNILIKKKENERTVEILSFAIRINNILV